ncbi:MAG: adenosylmethionine decarboxylase [Planctomycetota bacterium]
MAYPGTHCILELYDCPRDRLNDHDAIISTLQAAVEHAGATWLGQVSHQFTPQGITALGLLSESHISIHTWPESGYAAVDVFTCGDVAMPEKACEYLVQALGAAKHTLLKLARRPEPKPAEPISVEVLTAID